MPTSEYTAWAPERVQFDPSAYTPRPIETVVEQVTMPGNAYHPAPGATVTMKHDGTRFHSVTVENAETMFVLEGSDFDFEPGYVKRNFYHSYNGFSITPGARGGVTPGVPGSGHLMGWSAGMHKRRFVPDWYFRPLGDDTVMDLLLSFRVNQPETENPFDHLAGSVYLHMGINSGYVPPKHLTPEYGHYA